jgi:amidase
VRIPSAFCGIYGLRPSSGRIPYAGAANSLEGQDSIVSVLGPMSNSLIGIEVFMKVVINQKPWLKDPLAVRKSWDDDAFLLAEHGYGKKLCFAVMWDDGITIPHPPIVRGLELTKGALITAGHNGVLFTVPFL